MDAVYEVHAVNLYYSRNGAQSSESTTIKIGVENDFDTAEVCHSARLDDKAIDTRATPVTFNCVNGPHFGKYIWISTNPVQAGNRFDVYQVTAQTLGGKPYSCKFFQRKTF